MDDFAADAATTGAVSVGGHVTGSIEVAGDSDWFAAQLVQGQTYRVYLQGAQLNVGSTPGGTLADPGLQIRDAAGNVLATSTNSFGLNELVDFTAPSSGVFYLDASGAASGVGTYTLSVVPFTSVSGLADYLVNDFWSAPIQTNVHGPRHFDHTNLTVNVSGLGAQEQAFALAALDAFHEVAGLSFTVVSGAADITYSNGGSHVAEGGQAPNGVVNGAILQSTVQISSDWVTSASFATQAFQIYLHETLHALGLGHSGPYNGGDVRLGVDNLFANDTLQWTVMSYFGWPGQDLASRILSPQMADIFALQSIYGANDTSRLGDTTYGFNNTAGARFDLAAQTGAVSFTIYDSGGVDTLDGSGYAMAQILDLRPGAFSSMGGATGNIGIYATTTIENAIGGSASDHLIGNTADNRMFGRAGDDTIEGGEGSNYLRGEEGSDSLSGGSRFDDIQGNMGNDTEHGWGDRDWVVGGKDNDVLFGDDGDDVINGNLGDDTCDGGIGGDTVRGGQANDQLSGGVGDDWLSGDLGNDTISGGAGADTFHAFVGIGIDRITDFNRAEGDRVLLDAGTTYTTAQSGADTVVTISGGGQVILVGVQLSGLSAGWIGVG